NLGIADQRILPGNYYVLRNSDAPAILTESSYITNPDVESKLALAAKQRLEAEALYLGLAHYFARPRPEIEQLVARLGFGSGPDSGLTERGGEGVTPWLTASVVGPFDHHAMTLDGAPVTATRRGSRLTVQLPGLAAGPHVAMLRVGLSGSATARERRVEFRV